MRTVGLKVLKNKLSEYVRLAAAGETVVITDRGRVVAELVPPQPHIPAGEGRPLSAFELRGRGRGGSGRRPFAKAPPRRENRYPATLWSNCSPILIAIGKIACDLHRQLGGSCLFARRAPFSSDRVVAEESYVQRIARIRGLEPGERARAVGLARRRGAGLVEPDQLDRDGPPSVGPRLGAVAAPNSNLGCAALGDDGFSPHERR